MYPAQNGITVVQVSKSRLKIITVKVPPELAAKVARLAEARSVPRSQVVRDAIENLGEEWPPDSVGKVAGHLFGSVKEGPSDASTNPKYLKKLGRWPRR